MQEQRCANKSDVGQEPNVEYNPTEVSTPIFDIFKTPNQTPKNPNHIVKKTKRTPKRKFSEEEDTNRRIRPRTPSGQYKFNPIAELKTKLFNRESPEVFAFNYSAKSLDLDTIKEHDKNALSGQHDQCGHDEYERFVKSVNAIQQTSIPMSSSANLLVNMSEMQDQMIECNHEQTETDTNEKVLKKQSVMDKYIRDALQKSGQKSIEEATDPITMDI